MAFVRMTINLPDEVYRAARAIADRKGTSLGKVIAELVSRGLKSANSIDGSKPFPCFVVPEVAEPITLERTLEAEDEL
jgi:hypothetical protein